MLTTLPKPTPDLCPQLCNRCVRFAITLASGHATTKRTLLLLLGPDFRRLDRTSFAWRTYSFASIGGTERKNPGLRGRGFISPARIGLPRGQNRRPARYGTAARGRGGSPAA
jgi:hypothetical protein